MGQIRDIMEKNVITIGHDKSSLDAAKLISEKDISFLVVVKDGNPIGVVSERDFVRKITAEDKQSSKIPLSEIMSFKFRWVDPTTEIEEAVQKMLNHNIRRLLVLENEKLVGSHDYFFERGGEAITEVRAMLVKRSQVHYSPSI